MAIFNPMLPTFPQQNIPMMGGLQPMFSASPAMNNGQLGGGLDQVSAALGSLMMATAMLGMLEQMMMAGMQQGAFLQGAQGQGNPALSGASSNGNSLMSGLADAYASNPSGNSYSPNSVQAGAPPSADIGDVNLGRLLSAVPANIRKNAQKHFPYILGECKKQGVKDKNQIAYILATACHESNAGGAMEEFASGAAYEGRSSLGNTQAGDGRRFKGRGYVQLTGRRNYADWSRRLGIDLVGRPEMAKDPAIASKILVQGMMKGTFTGRKLGQFVHDGQADFNGARTVINGRDHAGSIGQTAQRLRAAM